jgi:flagellar hook-associated protein 2
MASLTASGIGSGLDINSIVSQLVSAERAPQQNRLDAKEALIQARMSAYGTLKSALTEFQGSLATLKESETFAKRSATVSDSSVFTASADSSAVPGNYAVSVEQLASRHKIATQAYANANSVVGTGNVEIAANGQSFSVAVVSGEGSLSAIRDAINSSEDNFGVTASIVNGEDGSHLVLSADKTGLENQLTVTAFPDALDTGDLSQLAFDPQSLTSPMTEKAAATDTIVIVDGFTQTSANDQITGMIQGITLNLNEAKPGEKIDLVVSKDVSSVRKAIESFVENYNTLISTVKDLTAYDPEANTAGLLQGDTTTRNIANRLRQEISAVTVGADSEIDSLAELGITTTDNGSLEIDSGKLNQILDTDFDSVPSIFAGDSGYATRLDGLVANLTENNGLLSTRTGGLESQIERIGDQRDALERRIATIEARYTAQFSALDSLIGQLSSTGEFLTQQLANLPGITQKNS